MKEAALLSILPSAAGKLSVEEFTDALKTMTPSEFNLVKARLNSYIVATCLDMAASNQKPDPLLTQYLQNEINLDQHPEKIHGAMKICLQHRFQTAESHWTCS